MNELLLESPLNEEQKHFADIARQGGLTPWAEEVQAAHAGKSSVL